MKNLDIILNIREGNRGDTVITFDPLWKTLERKKITKYALIHKYNVSQTTLYRMFHNENITLDTINTLCELLECGLDDVINYIPDK